MEATLVVLPTSRSIREQILLSEASSFLTKTLTIAEFFQKTLYVPNKTLIDSDTRNILLLEASRFDRFDKLQIERNFFSFLSNSTYVFRFFEEISSEMVTFSELLEHDLYMEYEEHILILEELYKRYKVLLDKHNLYDPITLPQEYQLYKGFIQQFSTVVIYAEGIFTQFELALLKQIASLTRLQIDFTTSRFNQKASQRLEALLDKKLEYNRHYLLDLTKQEIIAEEKRFLNIPLEVSATPNRLLQVGFVWQKVYEFIQAGIDPSKIAIITPIEGFSRFLELFDAKHNINLAMGRSFQNSFVYQKLKITLEAFKDDAKEVVLALERVGSDLYEAIIAKRKTTLSFEDLEKLLESLVIYAKTQEEKELLQEEIFRFMKLFQQLQSFPLEAILHLFLNRIGEKQLSDVGGGKITVMGVLETRAVTYDGVIVVDFNENNVPKRSDKDMFLSSKLRQHAGLPTTFDRENLQKDYYYKLFSRAKKVAISYVESTTNNPSRFLKELPGVVKKNYSAKYLSSLLFTPSWKQRKTPQEQEVAFDFTKTPLSATMLESFLGCKQQFFFRYVQKLKEAKLPTNLPQEWEVGASIHMVLKKLYIKTPFYTDVKKLQKDFETLLYEELDQNVLHRFWYQLYKEQLQPFFHKEIERFAQGVEVFGCEVPLERRYGALKLYGVCDRIDKTPQGLEIVDYKTGSIKVYNKNSIQNATSFQLEFYTLLGAELGEVVGAYFYDLKNAMLVQEPLFKQKQQLLEEHLHALTQTKSFLTTQTEDTKRCEYCAYKILCGR